MGTWRLAIDNSREAMLEALAPYASLFEANGYYALLHLSSGRSQRLAESIRNACADPRSDRCIDLMLRDTNWRLHLVAAVATYVKPFDVAIEQLWAAVDADSWVSPQLAAVLSLCDDEFAPNAIDRLGRLIECYKAEPQSAHHRSAKSASSLLSLLQTDSPAVLDRMNADHPSELSALLARDVDGAGTIATSWRENLTRLLPRSVGPT